MYLHIFEFFSKNSNTFFRCRNAALLRCSCFLDHPGGVQLFAWSPRWEDGDRRWDGDDSAMYASKSWIQQDDWVVATQTFFMFIPIWGNGPNWLIFFKGVETTNQMRFFCCSSNLYHQILYQFFVERVWQNNHFGIINFIADLKLIHHLSSLLISQAEDVGIEEAWQRKSGGEGEKRYTQLHHFSSKSYKSNRNTDALKYTLPKTNMFPSKNFDDWKTAVRGYLSFRVVFDLFPQQLWALRWW